jgi:hypothetical protein
MRIPNARRLVCGIVIAGLALAAAPAVAASRPGSIAMTGPTAGSAVSGTATIDWVWRTGKQVRSTSYVDVAYSNNAWFTYGRIARRVSIRGGGFEWDTSTWPDGMYWLRVFVLGTKIASNVGPVMVDNTAPSVEITSPATQTLQVEDRVVDYTNAFGVTKLSATVGDGGSGVSDVVWYVDDVEVAQHGAESTFDFGTVDPGTHQLSVVARDIAGNQTTKAMSVFAAPFPAAGEAVKPSTGPLPVQTVSPTPMPSDTPSPDPSSLPTLPASPTPPAVPATPPAVPGPLPTPSA